MNVLSLFDGMSCGQIALERANVKVNQYFASEIDKYAIKVTQHNYPNTIQLGDVTKIKASDLPKIDLLIGGSPCQSFSFAGKRKGMTTKDNIEILTLGNYMELKNQNFEFEGQSYLFWEYMRILNELKEINPNIKFLLENVEMGEKWEKVLSKAIGLNGIHINSSLVSAQNRKRIYWTNIGMNPSGLFGYLENTIKQPKDKKILLKDILESEVDEKYYLSDKMIERITKSDFGKEFKNPKIDKSTTLLTSCGRIGNDGCYIKIDKKGNVKDNQNKASCFTAGGNSGGNHSDMDLIVHNTMPRSSTTGKGGTGHLTRKDGKTNAIEIKSYIRRLTPIECERLQTVPDNYSFIVSNSQRYKMLGNGWTVDVIAHIFSFLPKEYFNK